MKPIIQKAWMAIAMLCLSVPAFAYDFEADGYYFNITDETNKEVEVTYKDTSYSSYSGVANIPEQVNYNENVYTVTSIGKNAFSKCSSLLSVTIPNTVTTIKFYAFFNCNNLQSITMGTGLTKIDGKAFYYTSIAKAIWLCNTKPEGYSNVDADINYVSNNQFYLSNQKVYPFLSSKFEVDGVVYVPVSPSDRTCDVIDCNYAPSSTEIKIDEAVVNKGVELKVLNINDYSFYGNPRITSLSANCNGCIGMYAFYNCDALTTLEANNEGCIGYRAFENCDALTSVEANNNGYIGNYAFYDCDALKSVELYNKSYIGEYAFAESYGRFVLKAFNEGNIDNKAFENCVGLKEVTIKSKGNIGEGAFSGCVSIEKAIVDNGGSLGLNAFSGCKGMKNLTLGDAITTIGVGAFKGCSSLPTVSVPDNVSSIGESIFWGCSSLESVKFGRGLSTIPEYAFYDCASLKTLSIPDNIGAIEDYAFSGCTSLGDVKIEDDEQIDKETHPMQTFPAWTSTNHYLNSTSDKEYTFDVIPGDVLSFDYNVSSELGHGFLTIELDGDQIVRVSGDKSGGYKKIFYMSGQITLYMAYTKDLGGSSGQGRDEASVTNIRLNKDNVALYMGSNGGKPLFRDCPLDDVYIGRKLSYKTSPFYHNTSLRSVKITDAETQIYDNEFYGCSNLQEFSCGDGVESIGKWAFSGCSAMKSYASGSNVKTIGDEAFSDCTGLTSFSTSAAVPPTCGNQALDDINKWECVLHVPSESVDDYKAADQWKEFFFVEPTSGIENVAVDGAEVQVTVGDGGLSFGGDAERNVYVYSIDGQLQYSATVQPGEEVSLPGGLYIVRIGTQTVKVRI